MLLICLSECDFRVIPGTPWKLFLNTNKARQNGCRFADDILKCIFLNENARISLKISLKFVPQVRINNIPALVQIMAWRRPGDKPFSEPMMVSLLTHVCVTRPQWVYHKQDEISCVLDIDYGCPIVSNVCTYKTIGLLRNTLWAMGFGYIWF